MDFITSALKSVLYWGFLVTGSLIAADVAAVTFCMMVFRGFKLPPKPTVKHIEVHPLPDIWNG